MIEPLEDRRFLLEMSGEVVSFPLANILAIQGETYNNVSIDTSMVSFDAIDYYFQVIEEDVIAFQIGIGDIFTKTTEALTRTFKVTNKLVDGYGWVKLVAILVTSESLVETPVEIIPNGITVVQGIAGDNGVDGLSNYQIAVNNGFIGTEQDWLDSMQPNVAFIKFSYGDATPATILLAPANTLILKIECNLFTSFNGTNPLISVGDANNTTRFLDSTTIDVFESATYEVNPNFLYLVETAINLYLTIDNSTTQGAGIINIYHKALA